MFSRWQSGLRLATPFHRCWRLDATPLERELLVQADKLVGGSDAVMVIDDPAVPKKGKHSVGVASQYASALGKNTNFAYIDIQAVRLVPDTRSVLRTVRR